MYFMAFDGQDDPLRGWAHSGHSEEAIISWPLPEEEISLSVSHLWAG